ncbi:HAMP domain-containing sensor histidine kinase [Pseudarthrobacter phenanthrenivorans]|uniref:sensor histidine kinase n=1 Tax=Pseudarthrobacter phenanthrenivorans TaxID=361575 RepID=UPI00344F4E0E
MAFTEVTALVEALAVKDQFIASVSHELRTPLTSILGYLAMAQDEDLNLDLEDYLSVLSRNTQRLLGMVDDLLASAADALSTYPGRQISLKSWPTALKPPASGPCQRASPSALTLKGHAAQRNFRPGTDSPSHRQSGFQRRQIHPCWRVCHHFGRRNRERLYCRVTDTGVGMTEDERSQALTRFFRAAHLHSSTIPGAGLGLPITKSIIENHKGTITISSGPGKGTTVILTLPRTAGDAMSAGVSA